LKGSIFFLQKAIAKGVGKDWDRKGFRFQDTGTREKEVNGLNIGLRVDPDYL